MNDDDFDRCDDEDNGDHLPFFELEADHQAVLELTNALMVKWDDIEEVLAEIGPSPLVAAMHNVCEMFNHAHPVLVNNDKKSNVMQFGAELYAFGEVATQIHELLDTEEFARAQWGCAYAYVEEKTGIPAAVLDTFEIGYDWEKGFTIKGIKPLFQDGFLIPEAWGAAHQLIDSGDYDTDHLQNLPRPDENYFFDSPSVS